MPAPAHEPVDDHLDRVLLVALELELGRQVDDLTVDPGAREALPRELVEQRVVLALAAAHHRREHLEPGAVGQLQHPVDDLLRRLAGDELAAVRAVRHADPRVEQAQVVVDLGDRADGGARVARRRFLVDRDRGRQALDEVDVGLVHLAEELPGVRRQRLDVAALALGVDGVERQRRLARAGETGEHDQPIAGQHEVDVAEVVLARPADDDRVAHCRQRTGSASVGEHLFALGRVVRSDQDVGVRFARSPEVWIVLLILVVFGPFVQQMSAVESAARYACSPPRSGNGTPSMSTGTRWASTRSSSPTAASAPTSRRCSRCWQCRCSRLGCVARRGARDPPPGRRQPRPVVGHLLVDSRPALLTRGSHAPWSR